MAIDWKVIRSKEANHKYRTEWLLLQAAVLVICALMCVLLYLERERDEAMESDRLQVQARVIEENLARQLGGVNNALSGILDDFPNWDYRVTGVPAAAHRLRDLSGAMPDIRTLAITDPKGTVIVANRTELIGTQFVQTRYWATLREPPDPATVYVSPPFKTALGDYVISLSRALIGPKQPCS